jgi:hypothetical protein
LPLGQWGKDGVNKALYGFRHMNDMHRERTCME